MHWFLLALIPPAIWSATNHLDKYLISRYFKGGGVGALMMFSSIIGVFISAVIAVIHPEVLRYQISQGLIIALNGFLYLLATLPYLHALRRDEASIAVPLYQLIPVFTYFFAWFLLGETLGTGQLLGGSLILVGAVAMSLDLSPGKKISIKKDVLLLMTASSVLFALNFLLFKYFAVSATFWVTSFWEYAGFAAFALLTFVFVKGYRDEFLSVLRENRSAVLSLNGANEVLNIVAKSSFNFVSLTMPITLTWVVNGLQPLFVFVYGVLLTVFFPHISQEKISGRHLTQKILAIAVMFVGAVVINR